MSGHLREVAVAYAVAGAVALAVGAAVPTDHPLWVVLWADLAATLAIFAWSFARNNSSFYDPYWSVAPLAIALYFAARAEPGASGLRQLLVIALVALWGARLSWNWAQGWQGLEHEDWRYVRLREQTGAAWWPVSLLGVHGAPTLWVYLGCLPLYPALAVGTRPLGLLDALACAVTAGAIWLEARADAELRRFRRAGAAPAAFLATGLWSRSRHPNYLGEMGFWWGLFLFGLAAAPSYGWTVIGAVGITAMFRFVSLPMIETRMRERRPGWDAHAQHTNLVWPRLSRGPRADRA